MFCQERRHGYEGPVPVVLTFTLRTALNGPTKSTPCNYYCTEIQLFLRINDCKGIKVSHGCGRLRCRCRSRRNEFRRSLKLPGPSSPVFPERTTTSGRHLVVGSALSLSIAGTQYTFPNNLSGLTISSLFFLKKSL